MMNIVVNRHVLDTTSTLSYKYKTKQTKSNIKPLSKTITAILWDIDVV